MVIVNCCIVVGTCCFLGTTLHVFFPQNLGKISGLGDKQTLNCGSEPFFCNRLDLKHGRLNLKFFLILYESVGCGAVL